MFKKHNQFLIYFIILACCTAIDYSVVYLMNLKYGYVVIAVSMGHFISVTLNFGLQKILTFTEAKAFHYTQILRYIFVVFIIWLITVIIVDFCIYYFGLHIIAGKLIAQPGTFVIGFLLMKYFVFPVAKTNDIGKSSQ